eukprot:3627844-Amphidinium_carterae.1
MSKTDRKETFLVSLGGGAHCRGFSTMGDVLPAVDLGSDIGVASLGVHAQRVPRLPKTVPMLVAGEPTHSKWERVGGGFWLQTMPSSSSFSSSWAR